MRIKIDRRTFANALAEVVPFAPTKPTIPILRNAKVTTKDGRMKIEANDTENAIAKYIPTMECDTNGSFLINISELNKFVARIKSQAIEIEVSDGHIEVRHDKGKAEFTAEDHSEYPSFKVPDAESKQFVIPPHLMHEAIVKGKNFVSTETIRPMMCAIYAYVRNGEFGYCASDTHKLIHGHSEVAGFEPEFDVNFYIMPSVFNAVANLCKGGAYVSVAVTEKHVTYRVGSDVIQTVQTKGRYPDFNRVIPREWNMECAVDKVDIIDALGRVAMFSDNSECVKVSVSRMDMTLRVNNLDYGKSATETLAHSGCGGEINIGLNVGYLIQALGAFDSGEILMRMTDPSRPVLFGQADKPGLTVLQMPIQIIE